MDIGKYVIYLYYVYIMTHMFNIWFICLSYDSYDLYDFYEFSVSLCIHTRHPDDWLETAKNVLAVRLVYRHVHIWSYRSHVTTQFWLWLDWEIDIIILIYIFSYSYYYWTLEPLNLWTFTVILTQPHVNGPHTNIGFESQKLFGDSEEYRHINKFIRGRYKFI